MSIKREAPHYAQVAFVSPTYAQGKRNAWVYAKYYSRKIPGVKISESELTLTFPNKGKYFFMGSDNYESLRGMYLDHVSLDEFGIQAPNLWGDIIRPQLDDFNGSATFIGSANGRNHFWDLMKRHEDDPDWLITILKASETGILSPEKIADLKKTISEEQYQQEYECNFEASVKGAYYGKEISLAEAEGRISSLTYDRASPVYASWDIGVSDHMALWTFQVINQSWHWLNYYANYNEDLTHYVNWANSLPYKIKTHFLPHDAKKRDPSNLKTSAQFLEGLDLDIEMVPKVSNVTDRINACRMIFNRCYFNKQGTIKGVDCLRMYESEWNEDDKVLALRPKHNWASHGADAFGTGVMGIEEKRKLLTHPEERFQGEGSWMG
jgi:hypothetical protein